MKINENVLNFMNDEIIYNPPETGGILGRVGRDETITKICMDELIKGDHFCSYSPNVEYLNKVIEQWSKKDIQFAGVFHTHFADVKTLSNADKQYINVIMRSMPSHITELFFPVYILPSRKLISYRACLSDENNIIIQEEKTKVV